MSEIERFAKQFEADPEELRRRLVEAMVLGAAADGHLDSRQSREMRRQIETQAELAGLEAEVLADALSFAFDALLREGFHVRLRALAAALPRYAHRVLAFRCAVQVALADGEMHDDELSLLREMKQAFGLAEADVARAFDDARDEEAGVLPASVEPVESYLDCLLLAAASNRHLADEERATLIAFIVSRPEFDGIPESVMREYLNQRLRAYAGSGAEERIRELAEELSEPVQRETAYGLAAAMVLADGDVDVLERSFLARLRQALRIDEARAALVLEGIADQQGGQG